MIRTTKNKIGLIVTALILFTGCQGIGGDPSFEDRQGFDIRISNYTNKEYTGFVLYIGRVKNEIFTAKDSLVANTVKIHKKDEGPHVVTGVDNFSYILSTEFHKNVNDLDQYGKWKANIWDNGGTRYKGSFKIKFFDGTNAVSKNIEPITFKFSSYLGIEIKESEIKFWN